MFDKVIESCKFLLNNFPEAKNCKDYLDNRLDKSSQEMFDFGYYPDIANISALTDLMGIDELKATNLFNVSLIEDSLYPRNSFYSYFDNHPLIMPYKDPYGNIVGIVGRTLLPESEWKAKKISKYKNTAESNIFKKGHLLFGLYENKKHILEQNSVFIVEGQFDVIKATEKGFKNIVALGNSNMTSYQFSVISRYTNNIFLLLDNDQAGEKGRSRIVDKFGGLANIRNFYLPSDYKDVDDYLSQNSYASLSLTVKD